MFYVIIFLENIREVILYAIFFILNDIYKLDEIHELFFEEELGATTIDSQGMGKVLLDHNINIPMLASMRKMIDGRKPYNKLIISVVREEEKLRKITSKIKKKLNCFENPGMGFLFVIPVLECYGSKTECTLEDLEDFESGVDNIKDEDGKAFI